MRSCIVFISCLFLSALSSPPITSPDPDLTPSSYCSPSDPDFTEYRYDERIPWCRRNVAQATKVEVYRMYGMEPDRDYTIDHLIPLSLGGSNHIDNLWPQHKSAYSGNLEYQMYLKLRRGEITRQDAVEYVLAFKYEDR